MGGAPESLCGRRLVSNLDIDAEIIRRIVPQARGTPQIIRKYEGTRLGRQEIEAELLDDVPGALWNRTRLEELRWPLYKSVPDLVRIVVAIDPATTSGEDADETGIIVADFRPATSLGAIRRVETLADAREVLAPLSE